MTQLHHSREQPRGMVLSLRGVGAGEAPPRPAPGRGLPIWLSAAPFVGLHLACLGILFVGAPPLALVLCGVTYFVRMFGVTGAYHRYFAHRAYKTSRPFQFVLAWLGCSALQKGPLWWVGHHRHHHRYSDDEDDPHSPHRTSFWWSHVGWILSEDHYGTPAESVKDWSRYPELRWLDRYHWVPGISLAVLCFLIGLWTGVGAWSCLVWGFVVSTVLLYHAVFCVNSLCHLFGSRRYDTSDDSRNNLLVALLTLGEGWHNNHHHYQSSTKQGFFWWEIDISYYLIKLLGLVGLVWDIREPPPDKLRAGQEKAENEPVPQRDDGRAAG
jgi:stearoyl-CoA desaturase (Delta-9 desaturase)